MGAQQQIEQLGQRWAQLQAAEPGIRIRNAAQLLGVSELELLLTRSEGVQRLQPRFGELMTALEAVGEVMVLTRNEEVVHEVTGPVKGFKVSGSGAMGLCVGLIDLRVFLRHWRYGLVVQEQTRSGERESLQFFSAAGQALHKVYRTEGTDRPAWQALVAEYLDLAAEPVVTVAEPAKPARMTDLQLDVEALRQDWASLKDVHHFDAMLRKHQVDRLTALALMGPAWCRPLHASASQGESALDVVLAEVQAAACPVMVFVGNRGVVQIYTGVLERIRRTGEWLNVLDTAFNLHARTPLITDWWLVRRPSTDGHITSIEGYNTAGELVITLFGKRKPGEPELVSWRESIRRLESALCD